MGLDGYRLRAQLGAGPDGVAYRAETEDGRTPVIAYDLSSARAEPGRWKRLLPRLRLAAELDHPGAIRILELGSEEDPPYAILEWTGSTTLAAAVEAGLTSEETTRTVGRALTEAVGAAHRLGLAHGRLIAERVFVGEDGQPKLDFTGAQVGFPAGELQPARFADTTHAHSEPADMGSERAGDLYDLGALLELLQSSRTGKQTPESDVGMEADRALRTLIVKLRSPDPAERPTAGEVQTQLESLYEPLDVTGNWAQTEAIGSATMALPRIDGRPLAGTPGSVAAFDAGTNPARLGRYQLLDKLGEGGQGVVYRASDPADGSIVALKVLRTDRGANSAMLRRFRKEARLMAQVNNPNVVNLLEYNEDDGAPYLVLEFVAGDHLGACSKYVGSSTSQRPSRSWPAWPAASPTPTSAGLSTATSSLPISSCSSLMTVRRTLRSESRSRTSGWHGRWSTRNRWP